MAKNMESADISIDSTAEEAFIVFSSEYVSKSHKQIDLSVEPDVIDKKNTRFR